MTMPGLHSLTSGSASDLRPRVLVADDDPVTRTLIHCRLESLGALVFEAEDGSQALRTLGAESIDLLIADVEMPNMNGLELIGRVRAHPHLHVQRLPVVVLTGSEGQSAKDAAFATGATSFHLKPLKWTAFGHHIRTILETVMQARILDLVATAESPTQR